jgi:hypothetical protein
MASPAPAPDSSSRSVKPTGDFHCFYEPLRICRGGFFTLGEQSGYSFRVRTRLLLFKSWIGRHAVAVAMGASATLIALAIVVLIALGGFNNTPGWWGRVDTINPADPQVIEQAERFENAITTQLTAMRDQEDPKWAVAITQEQANAWLAVRLVETINTHMGSDAWPEHVMWVRVEIKDDRLTIGVRMAHTTGSMVVWGRVSLEVNAEGALWAQLSGIHIGTTPAAMWLVSAMSAGEGVSDRVHIGSASIKLGDGRIAEIIGVRVSGGRLELAMQTIVKDN